MKAMEAGVTKAWKGIANIVRNIHRHSQGPHPSAKASMS